MGARRQMGPPVLGLAAPALRRSHRCERSLTVSSTVVDARVPDPLKQALEAGAQERSLSLTCTVVELLEQGLEATDDERARGLEAELAASTSEPGRREHG
jgi:hypothetical protein